MRWCDMYFRWSMRWRDMYVRWSIRWANCLPWWSVAGAFLLVRCRRVCCVRQGLQIGEKAEMDAGGPTNQRAKLYGHSEPPCCVLLCSSSGISSGRGRGRYSICTSHPLLPVCPARARARSWPCERECECECECEWTDEHGVRSIACGWLFHERGNQRGTVARSMPTSSQSKGVTRGPHGATYWNWP